MVKLELRFSRDFESQIEYAIAASYFVRPHEHLVSQFIVEQYCRNSRVEVVEREGAAAGVRCLHFVLPLAELGLDQKIRHATFASPSGVHDVRFILKI